MTKNGAKFEKKKYKIITFSLLAFFFLFGFLSKHLKEPVKPVAKTHHIYHTLSSKSSSSHKKEKTKSSTTTSKEDKKKRSSIPFCSSTKSKTKQPNIPPRWKSRKVQACWRWTRLGRTRRWLLCHKRRGRWGSRCSLRRRCWWRKQSRKLNPSEQWVGWRRW